MRQIRYKKTSPNNNQPTKMNRIAKKPAFKNLNFVKDISNYSPNGRSLTTVDFLAANGRDLHTVEFNGKVASNGVMTSNFDGNTALSIAFTFDNPKEQNKFEELFSLLQEPVIKAWNVAPLVKSNNAGEPMLYLKLKTNKEGNFTFENNIGLYTPADHELDLITRGASVKVVASTHAYFDMKKKTYGVYLTLISLDFDPAEISTTKAYFQGA